MMDELEKLQTRCDEDAASWPESRQLILYIVKGMLEKQKAHDDAIMALKMRSAIISAACGCAGGLIPVLLYLVSHITFHP